MRQGCPLAPLLFVLAVDAFAAFTMQAYVQGLLKGYPKPSHPDEIPWLQYVVDIMFSIEGSVKEARNLSTLLDLFEDSSVYKLIALN